MERQARLSDQRFHGYPDPTGQVAQGRVGPMLACLRRFPPVVGLVVGAYGEVSESVAGLQSHLATVRASAVWGAMGFRSEAEARGVFVARLRRRWGVLAFLAGARCRVSRAAHVFHSHAGSTLGVGGMLHDTDSWAELSYDEPVYGRPGPRGDVHAR